MEKAASSEQRNLAGRNIDLIDINKDEPLNVQSEKYLQYILASLQRDKLIDLLVVIGMQNPEVAERIRAVASSHPSESLCDAFSSHGENEEGTVVVYKATGPSRGFFITFKNMESVLEALKLPWGMINDSPASCNLSVFDVASKKHYDEDLTPELWTKMFRSFFRKYAKVEEGSVVYDRETNRSRGLGFATCKTDGGARRAINDPDKILGGRKITVQMARAEPKGKEKETQEEPAVTSHAHPQPKDKEKETQEEPAVTSPPRTLNSPPHANAQQHDQLQSDQVPHPHVSRNEPSGIPSAYATAIPHPHVSGIEPSGIPSAYATAISGFSVPHPLVIGNEPYGIPWAYPTAISGYFVPHPHVCGNLLYEIPSAYPTGISGYPAVPHPLVRGNGPYGIPLVYPTGISGYRPVPHPPADFGEEEIMMTAAQWWEMRLGAVRSGMIIVRTAGTHPSAISVHWRPSGCCSE